MFPEGMEIDQWDEMGLVEKVKQDKREVKSSTSQCWQ